MAKLKHNAFTIVEMVVAMGLLVLLVGLSSMVFSTSVKAHRKAVATIEITRNLHVLTEQLSADLDSLRKDAPLFLGFKKIDYDNGTPADSSDDYYRRFDTIHFFANGDFQTTKQYPVRYDSDYDGILELSDEIRTECLFGNIARIYYGHANSDITTPDFEVCQVFSRKSHILTSHEGVSFEFDEIPQISTGGVIDYSLFSDVTSGFGVTTYTLDTKEYTHENGLEFNTITLTEWGNALNYDPVNADHFINYCMDDDSRPFIDLSDYETLHNLMAQGVMDFSVQWAYTSDDLISGPLFEGIRWWPSTDPGTGMSDFDLMNSGNPFGVYFGLPNGTTIPGWYAIDECRNGISGTFVDTFYPKALKFTFRLKDSNNIFPEGKTFTHIVTIDN